MNFRPISLAAFAALTLAACQESQSDTAKDVAKASETAAANSDEARQEATATAADANAQVTDAQQAFDKASIGAQKKLTQAEADAMSKNAKANYDVAITDAEGRQKIANEKCGALTGADKDACLSTAKAAYAAEEAAAVATRDAELVKAENHE